MGAPRNTARPRRAPGTNRAALARYFDELLGKGRADVTRPRRPSASRGPAARSTAPRPVEWLLFAAGGLILGVPRRDALGVERAPRILAGAGDGPREGSAQRIPGLLGHFRFRGRECPVLDVGCLVAPPRRPVPAPGWTDAGSWLILLQDGPIALACERVIGTVTVDPGKVCWRTERTRRPWLAGVLTDRGCALLHVPGLVEAAALPNGE